MTSVSAGSRGQEQTWSAKHGVCLFRVFHVVRASIAHQHAMDVCIAQVTWLLATLAGHGGDIVDETVRSKYANALLPLEDFYTA